MVKFRGIYYSSAQHKQTGAKTKVETKQNTERSLYIVGNLD